MLKEITIIIPVYNTENHLEKCINSVLNQTVKISNIILVDDGSTDNSPDICDKYAGLYPNIKVIHKRNKGLGFARNSGLDISIGEYVTFLDSDDFLEPDHIENLYNCMIKNDADACYGGHTKINGKKEIIYRNILANNSFVGKEILINIIPKLCGQTGSTDDSIQMSVCMAMYKMEIIKRYHIRFKSEREYMSEDLLFNMDFLSHSNSIIFSDDVGYMYNYNPESLSHKYLPDRFYKAKIMKKIVTDFTKKLGIFDKCSQRINNTFVINARLSLMSEVMFWHQHGFKQSFNKFRNIIYDKELTDTLKCLDDKNVRMQARIINGLIKNKLILVLWCVFEIYNKLK